MQNMKLPTWEDAERQLDEYSKDIPLGWGYIDRVGKGIYPADAFSLGQLLSKSWLLTEYRRCEKPRKPLTVALLGCWIGTVVEPLFNIDSTIERVWGFDNDRNSVNLSNRFNKKYVDQSWKYKAVCEDVNLIDWSAPQFEVDGVLIEERPNIIINTSSEHMPTDWFDSAAPDQLIIMQTNDNHDLVGHTHSVDNYNDMVQNYPLSEIIYTGAITFPGYIRYMQIGYK